MLAASMVEEQISPGDPAAAREVTPMPGYDTPDHGTPDTSHENTSHEDTSNGNGSSGPGGAAFLGGSPLPGSGGDSFGGLSWSWQLDNAALVAALNEPAPWNSPPRRPVNHQPRHRADDPSHRPVSSPAARNETTARRGDDRVAVDHAPEQDLAADHPAARHPGSGHPGSGHVAPDHQASGRAESDGAPADGVSGVPWPVLDAGEAEWVREQEELEWAWAAGRVREVPAGVVAGRVAEALPAGPDLAG
ncbi:MAG TPA: hypothetical protein VH637_06465, partial [Streptosporangiaceae bacterium]